METPHQGEWKCATRDLGGQYVMITGTILMLEWSAGSLASHDMVLSDVALNYIEFFLINGLLICITLATIV